MKSTYDTLFKEATAEYLPTVDWRLLKAQGIQESRLNPNAVSPAGAMGLMQFMPQAWEEWSEKAGFTNSEPQEPEAAIYLPGSRYAGFSLIRCSMYERKG